MRQCSMPANTSGAGEGESARDLYCGTDAKYADQIRSNGAA